MMLLERFLPRVTFESYEDFIENYTVNIPLHFNFGFDVIDAWAAHDKEKSALVWCDDAGHEKTFTFDDVSRMSNQLANYFKGLGIGKGDAVLLILRRRYEYWLCAVALHKLGAILIPSTLQLTAKDIAYRIGAADIRMIVCVDDDFVAAQVAKACQAHPAVHTVMAAGRREGFLALDDAFACSDVFPRPTGADGTKSTDPMLIYFTSGTTGMPKMALHNFAHPLGHIVTAQYWHQVQEGKLHMSVSDSGWAKFGWGKIYGQWICGAVIFAYDMEKFVPLRLLAKLEQYKVTTFCAPPTMFRFMLQEDVSQFDLSSIERCGNAGEPLNPEVFRRWKDYTGVSMTEGFGQSESSVLIANFPWFDPKPGSMGKPAPLYDIALVDGDGQSCPDGVEGEIVIRNTDAVGLFRGYYQDRDVTAHAMRGGIYHTGDVAWRDSDGYYWFVGRNDDVIKCSGYRIGPFEVESALLEHPSVVECAVTAVPDPVRGQVAKATVVLAQKAVPSDALVKELQEHVKKVTAPYKYPRIIEFVPELPKTVGGKIKRAEIRHADSERFAKDAAKE